MITRRGWKRTSGFSTKWGTGSCRRPTLCLMRLKREARAQIEVQDELITYAEALSATPLILEDLDNKLRVPFGELQDYGVVVSRESIEPYHDWKLLLVNFRACALGLRTKERSLVLNMSTKQRHIQCLLHTSNV